MPSSTRPNDPSAGLGSGQDPRTSTDTADSHVAGWPSVKVLTNGVTWQVRPGWEWVVYGPKAPNWLHLIAEPHAEPVKRNAAREVWRVTIEEQEFFVKLYRETGISGIARALLRGPGCELEWRAGDHARRHQIPTVEPVAYGTIGARGLRGPGIFITRAMPRALPLNEHWSRRVLVASPDIRRIKASAVIEAAAHSVARAHQFGFLHRDLHAGNLLASEGDDGRPCIAFVDLHNVRLGSHVPDPLAVRNLAQLNQWFRRRASRTDRLRFLRHYIAFREDLSRRTGSGPNIGLSYRQLVKALGEAADRHARQLWAKRDRVAMRDGKYFCRLKTRGGWRGHAYLRAKHTSGHSRASQMQFNRSQWRCWLDNPLDLLRKDRSRLIKDSHTAYVCRAQLPADEGPLEIVCKRARPRTWLKKCYYLFCKSRNLESWRRGYQLLNRDLPTARPLAVMERRFAGLLLDSVVMTEALSRARDFDALLRMDLLNQDPRTLRRQKDQLIDRLARLVKDMQTKGFAHRDFKAANLMVQWDLAASQLPRIVLVDLDGLILRRRLSRRQRLRPLMRLNVSLDEAKVVTRTDRLRFLKAYATIPNGAREDWRSLWREIERMSYRKRAHKEKRRKWKLKRYGRA